MDASETRYIIGIDLGTTNSALSFVRPEGMEQERPPIELFRVPQLMDAGMVSTDHVLPSFLYLSGGHELPKGATSLPWRQEPPQAVGIFAREQGARVPGRLVASAKSWLCHGGVDRLAPILPWGADPSVAKVSPVDASACYLEHLKAAWNHTFAVDDEGLLLENQDIILTVPASFDEVARELTVTSARKAGLDRVTLIEEPLAAFYSWLREHEQDWDRHIRPGEAVLVCDVGGGTTDFSLITLQEAEGSPRFERLAVSDHLMLGGDNMDLALARSVEHKLTGKVGSLDSARWQALVHQCRQAKEAILEGREERVKVVVAGTGKQLIAGTLSDVLTREQVEQILVEGFFPLVKEGRESEDQRKGITEFGLPYAKDPAITVHLWRFLTKHAGEFSERIGRSVPYPDLIMFNGGVFRSGVLRDRVMGAVQRWFQDTAGPEWNFRMLPNPNPDLAVALGASYYGMVRRGRGVRVGSGSPRAYFLGLDSEAGDPLSPEKDVKALCILERGLDEGKQFVITQHEFEVLANQPVRFDLFSSTARSGDRIGDLVRVPSDELTRLPPLHTVIRFGKKAGKTAVPVLVEVTYTEIGTLELGCRTASGSNRWRLQFDLRGTPKDRAVNAGETLDEARIERAVALISDAFTRKGAGNGTPEKLVHELEEAVERDKESIPGPALRRLGDAIFKIDDGRNLGPSHEARWLNLLGFCIRPGFGDPLDEWRLGGVWKLFGRGLRFQKDAQCRVEWWILWRRAAGGLSAGQQVFLFQHLSTHLLVGTKKAKSKIRLNPQELVEMWRTAANLERLPADIRAELGRSLLTGLTPKKNKPHDWWVLLRLGARIPFYGPLDRVVSREEVSDWIERIIEQPWKTPDPVARAVSQLARLVGDRERDLPDTVLDKARAWMNQNQVHHRYIRLLEEITAPDDEEDSLVFGESLPSGIQLRGA